MKLEKPLAMFLILSISSALSANVISGTDQMLVKKGVATNLPAYENNKNGLVKVTDPEDIEVYSLFIECEIRGYYRLNLERGERTTIILPEEGNYCILIGDDPAEFAIKIMHELNQPPEDDYIPSESLQVIQGNFTKSHLTIRITRAPPVNKNLPDLNLGK